MKISFTKMHGLGNDFVVFDATSTPLSLTTEQLRFIADRHFGIGCDQILFIESSDKADVDFNYRIFNADGYEVQQCGNGARCFARFVHDKGLSSKEILAVQTQSGIIYPQIRADNQITVNMGKPCFIPSKIPFQATEISTIYPIDVDGEIYQIAVVSMGNPHAVLQVEDVDSAPVEILGAKLESHNRFPQRVNVGFMQVLDSSHIQLRVFERGVGETLACGTGACAAVVTGQRLQLIDSKVKVELRGGQLEIEWQGSEQDSVFMTGSATTVFEGAIDLDFTI